MDKFYVYSTLCGIVMVRCRVWRQQETSYSAYIKQTIINQVLEIIFNS
jgi:hypothetical protein